MRRSASATGSSSARGVDGHAPPPGMTARPTAWFTETVRRGVRTTSSSSGTGAARPTVSAARPARNGDPPTSWCTPFGEQHVADRVDGLLQPGEDHADGRELLGCRPLQRACGGRGQFRAGPAHRLAIGDEAGPLSLASLVVAAVGVRRHDRQHGKSRRKAATKRSSCGVVEVAFELIAEQLLQGAAVRIAASVAIARRTRREVRSTANASGHCAPPTPSGGRRSSRRAAARASSPIRRPLCGVRAAWA